ncbi:hypothetical protein SB861_37815 [Paraburkholderia sp. SIMBA_049]
MSLSQKVHQAIAMLFGGGQQLSNRNGFVDGAMSSWDQTFASPTALSASPGTFTGPVMWRAGAGTGGAGTISTIDLRTSADLAAMEGDDTNSCYKMVITAGSTGTVAGRSCGGFFQHIENVARYAGKSVTLAFKLKADAPLTIPSIIASQSFGTGGAPSAAVVFDKAVTWAVGTSFKKFSVRIDVPNLIGKTMGTTGNFLEAGFWLPPGVTTTGLYVAEAQIEGCSPGASPALDGTGGNPMSYEHRSFQAEQARVTRCYETIQCNGMLSVAACTAATQVYTQISYSPKRGIPVITLPSGSFTFNNATNVYAVTGLAASMPATNTAGLVLNVSGSPVVNTPGAVISAAGLVVIDARL